MRIGDLKQKLIKIYRAGMIERYRPAVLILGKPGIGKSYTVYEMARELAKMMNREFIDYSDDVAETILANPERYFVFVDFRLTEVEPSDLIGIPRQVNGCVKYLPLMWAKCLSKCPGVLLLDEITNIQRLDIVSAAYKIVFDRKVGFVKLHNDVFIIACGNRPEESSVANQLPAPLINRLIVLDVNEPTVDRFIPIV